MILILYVPLFKMADNFKIDLSGCFNALDGNRITNSTLIVILKQKLLLLFFLLITSLCLSQEFTIPDSTNTKELIDSLLIDRDFKNWSVRLFGNVKAQGFDLANDDVKLSYIPNNLYGVGIGVATRKLILDIAFNIKDKNTENTDRFDLQAVFFLKNNSFNVFFQLYDGFNVENSINGNSVFRGDIRSFATGIDHLYLFKNAEYQIRLLMSGLEGEREDLFSFGLGGFFIYNQISADESIVPSEFAPVFNEQGRITEVSSFGLGVKGGLVGLYNLPSNFFIGLRGEAGIGLTLKNVDTESISYNSKSPVLYKLKGAVMFGYQLNRFYTNILFRAGYNSSSLGYGNNSAFTLLSGKLALGYRIIGNKKSN